MERLLAMAGYAGSLFVVGATLLGGIDPITGLMAAGGMATAAKLIEGDSN